MKASRREIGRGQVETFVSSKRAAAVVVPLATTYVLAVLALIGQVAGVPLLTSLFTNAPSTKVNTAVACLLLAIAVTLRWSFPHNRAIRAVAIGISVVVSIAGALVLYQHISGRPLPIDEILMRGQISPVAEVSGRMSAPAASALILLAASVTFQSKRHPLVSQLTPLAASAIALTVGIGYIWFSPAIYSSMPRYAATSFITVLMIFALSAATVAAGPHNGIVGTILSDTFGGKLARRMLPLSIAIPLIVGWLRLKGEQIGLYGFGFGISLLVSSTAVLVFGAALAAATWLQHLDENRLGAEADSLRNAKRISDILGTAAEAILSFRESGLVTEMNRSARELFGCDDPDDLNIDDLVKSGLKGRNVEGNDDQSARPLTDSISIRNLRLVCENRHGKLFPAEGSLTRRHRDDEYSYMLVLNDVTERVQAENKIRELNRHLEEQVKRRTEELHRTANDLESFSYTVSHDLRAPLRAMSGYARMIAEDHAEGLSPETNHYLERIESNAVRMAELIDALLDFAKLSRVAVMREETDLGAIFADEAATAAASAPDGLIRCTIHDMPVCRADPALMRRVAANLLSNAVKFTPDGATPEIEIGFDKPTSAYFVRDSGVGFDPAKSDKLFRVFERLHSREQHEGTGIGLALAARIIERHNGAIWAESPGEKGATFYFTVGASPDVAEAPESAA